MSMFVRDETNTLVEIGAVFMRDAANVLVEVGEEWIRDGSGLHLVFNGGGGAFDVEVPSDVYGAGARNSAIAVTTEQAAVTVTGGTAPYTYQWQRSDAPLGVWTIVAPIAQATGFRCAGVGPGESESAQFTVKVTDANGASVTSTAILATAENYGSLGGDPIP